MEHINALLDVYSSLSFSERVGVISLGTLSFLFALSYFLQDRSRRRFNYNGKHVIITGGSSGIGKSLACLMASRGANITIVARTQSKLDEAKADIRKCCKNPNQRIESVSCDVTKAEDVQRMAETAAAFHNGSIDCLVACAGLASPGYFLDVKITDFEKEMKLNYLGSVYAVHAAMPHLIRSVPRGGGQVILVGSTLSLIGVSGYSAYVPTKWAVRGFGEVLRSEVKPYGVSVSIAYPPDTDTPGFQEENKTKPPCTLEISSQASVWTPEQVATGLLNGMESGHYHIAMDFDTTLLTVLMPGLAPRVRPVLELMLLPIVGLIGIIVGKSHDGIVAKWAKKRLQSKKAQ